MIGILAVVFLVMMNAFFVAAEFSLVTARRTRIEQLALDGNGAAVIAQRAMDHLDNYIAATQLGITLASLALGWIGEPAVVGLFDPLLRLFPEPWADTVGHSIAAALAFSLVTMTHIIFGELAPKAIALQRPESAALFVARPTTWFLTIFRPIIRAMNGIGNWIVRLLGFQPVSSHSSVHSPEELEMLVVSSREAGLLPESEERLLKRAFDFGDVQMRQVMRSRMDVDAVSADMPLPDLLKLISSSHHSRYPVYKESMDTVIGILHTKNLLDAIGHQPELLCGGAASFDLTSILGTALFIPHTATLNEALEQMQRSKSHIAIVIDEYGGMAGVATMEDILEELVGDVQDEFDTEANPIETQGDVTLVDGLVPLSEVSERFGEPGGKVISTTIGGYVAERLDRIPVLGDTVRFGEYDLRVEAMDGMRASKVRFLKRPRPAGRPGGSPSSSPRQNRGEVR